MALWDSPRQREAYDWFTVELANLRTAFRWAADHGDLDTGAAIATYAAFLGPYLENYEPIAWAEELSSPPAPSTILDSPPYAWGRRCAVSSDASKRPCAIARSARQ